MPTVMAYGRSASCSHLRGFPMRAHVVPEHARTRDMSPPNSLLLTYIGSPITKEVAPPDCPVTAVTPHPHLPSTVGLASRFVSVVFSKPNPLLPNDSLRSCRDNLPTPRSLRDRGSDSLPFRFPCQRNCIDSSRFFCTVSFHSAKKKRKKKKGLGNGRPCTFKGH